MTSAQSFKNLVRSGSDVIAKYSLTVTHYAHSRPICEIPHQSWGLVTFLERIAKIPINHWLLCPSGPIPIRIAVFFTLAPVPLLFAIEQCEQEKEQNNEENDDEDVRMFKI